MTTQAFQIGETLPNGAAVVQISDSAILGYNQGAFLPWVVWSWYSNESCDGAVECYNGNYFELLSEAAADFEERSGLKEIEPEPECAGTIELTPLVERVTDPNTGAQGLQTARLVITHSTGDSELHTMISNAAIDCFNQWLSEGYQPK